MVRSIAVQTMTSLTGVNVIQVSTISPFTGDSIETKSGYAQYYQSMPSPRSRYSVSDKPQQFSINLSASTLTGFSPWRLCMGP